MTDIQFSLVIPTRERPDTLRYALRSCLAQSFESYEIVVCDNCSSPETRTVVEQISSPKIVYHRSTEPLCMRDNWNLAYSLTRGKYVTFIGDDDSLLPYAFSVLSSLFNREHIKAICWDSAVYSWPNIARTDMANHLQIPIERKSAIINGHTAIRDVLARKCPGTLLPNIYHGCVARDVLEDIRSRSGELFQSYNCDTYTSFAVAYTAEHFLHLSVPLSISGFSASSNNIAFNFMRSKHVNAQKFRQENASANLKLDPRVPDLPSGFVCLIDSYLQARKDLFPTDPILFDRKDLTEYFISNPPIDSPEEWRYIEKELRRSISDEPELLAWFCERIKHHKVNVTPRDNYRPEFEGIAFGKVYIDAEKFGIHDIEGATRLTSLLLGYSTGSLNWLLGGSIVLKKMRDELWFKRLNIIIQILKKFRKLFKFNLI
jgi:glycosyltransferase involved in cell wall biosynthesis